MKTSMIRTIRDQNGVCTPVEALQAACVIERLHKVLQKLMDANHEAPNMTGTILNALTTATIAIEELHL